MKNYFAILGLSIVLVGCGSVKTNVDDLAVSHPIETALDLTENWFDKHLIY